MEEQQELLEYKPVTVDVKLIIVHSHCHWNKLKKIHRKYSIRFFPIILYSNIPEIISLHVHAHV